MRYPVDFGHNFVLADSRCNAQKRERLPACDHLAAWVKPNATYGDEIANALPKGGIVTKLPVSNQITKWVYAQTETANGLTWLRKDEMIPLEKRWRDLFASGPA
jgi:hypothetical protein